MHLNELFQSFLCHFLENSRFISPFVVRDLDGRNSPLGIGIKSLLRGSDSVDAINLASPAESRLLEVVKHGEMPPQGKGKPLSHDEIQILSVWVEQIAHEQHAAQAKPVEA